MKDRTAKTFTGKIVKIYNRVEAIYASKAGMPHICFPAEWKNGERIPSCAECGHRYQHKFSKRACIYGLPDGSLLIE
jgi:hypothetical protein